MKIGGNYIFGLETESISAVVGSAKEIKALGRRYILREHYSPKKVVQGHASDWADMHYLRVI